MAFTASLCRAGVAGPNLVVAEPECDDSDRDPPVAFGEAYPFPDGHAKELLSGPVRL